MATFGGTPPYFTQRHSCDRGPQSSAKLSFGVGRQESISLSLNLLSALWIPAFAGMTAHGHWVSVWRNLLNTSFDWLWTIIQRSYIYKEFEAYNPGLCSGLSEGTPSGCLSGEPSKSSVYDYINRLQPDLLDFQTRGGGFNHRVWLPPDDLRQPVSTGFQTTRGIYSEPGR